MRADPRRFGEKPHGISAAQAKPQSLAKTFWGRAWCSHLTRYSYHESRLPRGRTLLRAGAVLDLRLSAGWIEATIAGTRLCSVTIRVKPVDDDLWASLKTACVGQVESFLDLLQGRLSQAVMERVMDPDAGLFPEPSELSASCTCLDEASLCEHAAAALYGVGIRLDSAPDLLFTLRSVDPADLVAPIEVIKVSSTLDEANLGALFDLDMEP